MVITAKMLEELRKILAEHPLVIEDDDDLARHGLAVVRFVSLKELDKLTKREDQDEESP